MDFNVAILPVDTKDILISPVRALRLFIAMQGQHSYNVKQWLNSTYSRSHAFRDGRSKNTNPALTRIELTTSARLITDVWITYGIKL